MDPVHAVNVAPAQRSIQTKPHVSYANPAFIPTIIPPANAARLVHTALMKEPHPVLNVGVVKKRMRIAQAVKHVLQASSLIVGNVNPAQKTKSPILMDHVHA